MSYPLGQHGRMSQPPKIVSYWPTQIGPLTPPPTFAESLRATGAWVLTHPRKGPCPSRELIGGSLTRRLSVESGIVVSSFEFDGGSVKNNPAGCDLRMGRGLIALVYKRPNQTTRRGCRKGLGKWRPTSVRRGRLMVEKIGAAAGNSIKFSSEPLNA